LEKVLQFARVSFYLSGYSFVGARVQDMPEQNKMLSGFEQNEIQETLEIKNLPPPLFYVQEADSSLLITDTQT
jgi:hypothetical protein